MSNSDNVVTIILRNETLQPLIIDPDLDFKNIRKTCYFSVSTYFTDMLYLHC